MRFPFLPAALVALSFLPALTAQRAVRGDADRKETSVFVFRDSMETLAGVSIGYGQAIWRDGYDGMLKQLEGSNYSRLGTGGWTTFDTIGALDIGGTRIEAGSYYLGLAVDKDGAFSLLVFDSMQTMKAGLLPSTTALYRGEAKAKTKAPMTLAKGSRKDVVSKLEIEITADEKNPATGRLSIRWGKHELSAPVAFHLAAAKDVPAPKK